MVEFDSFFAKVNRGKLPFPWQQELALFEECADRLIRIPTGFGKTLGILSAWLWHHVFLEDITWPRRLVWCLPMRVLVEQTQREVCQVLDAAGVRWTDGDHRGKIGVHLLMGGTDADEWHLYPEESAVLIGTQDMLLSRAMNRGYGSSRARWPMEFGLLNQDCLWVMDEVQLMDVGLATSAQLQVFRRKDNSNSVCMRPSFTWWMSATLQPEWLRKSPDTLEMADALSTSRIPDNDRKGHLWEDVFKPCKKEIVETSTDLAQLAAREHGEGGYGVKGPTLVIVNRVDRAVEIYEALLKDKSLEENGTDIRLVHSRFRPAERNTWQSDFLNREACTPGTNRIIVSTQVVEAGVDISAYLLITELAPWASLVQRFGRCARWGGDAAVIIADFNFQDDKEAAPYAKGELDASHTAIEQLDDVAPFHLENFEEFNVELLPELYPYEPRHLLLRHELDELFDTTPDLSGADIDISRFIRTGEERDLQVFWHPLLEGSEPDPHLKPTREALCSIKFLAARDWLCGVETQTKKSPRLKKNMRAWVWDWIEGGWRLAARVDLVPGRTVLVAAENGGYDLRIGWRPESDQPVLPVPIPEPTKFEVADAALESESMSTASQWQTIAVHGREVGKLAGAIAEKIAPAYSALFNLVGRWHDVGKAHPAFNNSIVGPDKPARSDLAKAPTEAWLNTKKLYPMAGEPRRAGFRHELVSVLSLFSALQRINSDHPALLGPWRDLLEKGGFKPLPSHDTQKIPESLENEILQLDAEEFNLAAYLICAHHGKVRIAWHASPADQDANDEELRIMGVKNGDEIPRVTLQDSNGEYHEFPEYTIDLSVASAGLSPKFGAGWTERVLNVLKTHGPFALAWMEGIIRAADQRASRLSIRDDILNLEEAP